MNLSRTEVMWAEPYSYQQSTSPPRPLSVDQYKEIVRIRSQLHSWLSILALNTTSATASVLVYAIPGSTCADTDIPLRKRYESWVGPASILERRGREALSDNSPIYICIEYHIHLFKLADQVFFFRIEHFPNEFSAESKGGVSLPI